MKSILVLEEDVEGRAVLSNMLRRRGFRVYPVGHETSAFAALDSDRHIDLVLTGATDRDRTDFLAGLRVRRPSMPAIFLTSCQDAVSRERLLSGGFSMSHSLNFYMNTRPVDLHELDRLIRIALIPQRQAELPGIRAA